MQALVFLLTAAVVSSGVQWSLRLPLMGKVGLPICPADLLLAAAFATAIYLAARGSLKLRAFIPPWAPLALLAVMALAWFASGTAAAGVKEMLQIIEMLVIGLVLLRAALAPDGNSRGLAEGAEELLSGALVAAAGAAVAVGLYQRYTAPDCQFKWAGLLDNRNYLGGFMALVLPFLAGEYVLPAVQRPLPLRIIAAATMLAGMLLVPNIIVLAAIIAGVIIALDAGEPSGAAAGWLKKAVLAAMLLVVPVLAARPHLAGGFALYRQEGATYKPSARTRRWQAVLTAASRRPLLGFGPGCFQEQIGSYYRLGFAKPEGATDDIAGYDLRADEPGSQGLWEVALAETGIFGVAAWLLLIGAGVVAAFRHGRPAAAGALIAAGIAGAAVAVWARAIGVLWAYMLALAASSRQTRHIG